MVVLLGGPSGCGKSTLASALAARLGADVARIDDMQTAIEALVPEDRLPEYFVPARRWRQTRAPDVIAASLMEMGDFLAPAIQKAAEWRIESVSPTVFEGDLITPRLAAALDVPSLFFLEDEAGLRAGFLAREGDEQPDRAAAGAAHSRLIHAECLRLGLPFLPARPFETLAKRAIAILDSWDAARQDRTKGAPPV